MSGLAEGLDKDTDMDVDRRVGEGLFVRSKSLTNFSPSCHPFSSCYAVVSWVDPYSFLRMVFLLSSLLVLGSRAQLSLQVVWPRNKRYLERA